MATNGKQKKPERNLYVEAFTNQYNLILLGFAAILCVLLWNPLPMIAAAGLELIFMALVPGTDLFRRYVDMKYREIDEEERQLALRARVERLTPDQQYRYKLTQELVLATRENIAEHGTGLLDDVSAQLENLQERYLRMMESLNLYETYLNSVSGGQLHAALRDLEQQLGNAPARLKASLSERRTILQKRIERLEHVRENHEVLRTQLATVQDMLMLIKESSMTIQNPKGISDQLEGIMSEMEMAEEAVREVDDLNGGTATVANFDAELAKAVQAAEVGRR